MIYNNSIELGDNTLKYLDEIVFNINGRTYEYIVMLDHLKNRNVFQNNVALLSKIDFINTNKFFRIHYGYPVNSEYSIHCGCWPEYNINDYGAITRLVKALFKICEKYTK